MAKNVIRIQIPAELQLSENEIASLDRVFRAQLAVVEGPGDVEPIPFKQINTTKMAVEIEVIRPERAKRKKSPDKSKSLDKGK
jgi:hypothetical protein